MKRLLFVIALGLTSVFIPAISLIYLIFLIIQWFQKNNKLFSMGSFLGIVEICGLEFWGRLTDMDPYFPYELSKYILVVYMTLFIFTNNHMNNSITIFLMIIVLWIYSISSIAAGASSALVYSFSNGIIIILMGHLISKKSNVYIGISDILFLTRKWIDFLLIALVFVLIKTPELSKIQFTLGANYYATGGESSNQVSTYFGFASFLILFMIITKNTYSGYRYLDYIILMVLILQSLLTFSRGGVLVFLGLSAYTFYILDFLKLNGKRLGTLLFVTLIMIMSYLYLDNITNGLLTNRYKGETNATIRGLKEKNLNVITSNRLIVVEDNIKLFKKNIFGVGLAFSTLKRMEIGGYNIHDHTEPSRWLVEYGLFGIILIIWFIIILFKYVKIKFDDNIFRAYSCFLVVMILFSVLTMLHSATRTFVSFLPMVVGFIKLNPNVATANRRNKSPQKA